MSALSTEIGCGVASCAKPIFDGEKTVENPKIIFCQYRSQDIKKQIPFSEGPPCSSCGENSVGCEKGLCLADTYILSDCPFITTTVAPAPLFTTKAPRLDIMAVSMGVSNQTMVDFGSDTFPDDEFSTQIRRPSDASILTDTGGFIQNQFFETNAKYLESENMRWSLKVPGANSYEVTIIELELDQDCSDSVILWDAQQMTELLALRSCDPKVINCVFIRLEP